MKNGDILLDAIGGADEDLIPDLKNINKTKRRVVFRWASLAAACVAFAFCLFLLPKPSDQGGETSGQTFSETEETSVSPLKYLEGDPETGVYVPLAMSFSENGSGEEYGSVPVEAIIYDGRVFTRCAGKEIDPEKAEELVGEYIGTAKENETGWPTLDESAAGPAQAEGDKVYSVKGYDTDFRICVYDGSGGPDGDPVLTIFDKLNEITLRTGSDLFEDRLHVSENLEKVLFMSRCDSAPVCYVCTAWEVREADIDPETWRAFWTQVENGAFLDLRVCYDETGSNIYDELDEARIELLLSDGTSVRLRIFDSGYVGYEGLGWYFVKIPEDVFNTVYDAINGTS